MSSPPKPRVQRDRQRDQFERSSPPKIDFGIDSTASDLMPPVRAPYVLHKSSSVSSGSTASSPDRERGPIAYPNYYDYTDPEPQLAVAAHRPRQQNGHHSPQRGENNMANMAMQVPIQQQQGQGRLVDNARNSSSRDGPVTTQQIAQAARNNGGAPRGSRPPSYSGSQHGPRSPDDPPLNKVDIDAARYRQTQQRRPQQPTTKDGRPPTNGSNRAPSSGGGVGGMVGGRPISPESPLLSPAAHIQRLPTPSITSSVLQPLDAKVTEYGALMAEAQGDMAALDEEMRQLQDRQREAEARFIDAKTKHDDYRRQYHDVERALRGDFSSTNLNGVPPVPSMPTLTGSRHDMMDGGGPRGMHQQGGGGAPMGGQPPAMRSQRTVSAHSEQPSMMSQESVRTQKRGRFSRIFGV